MSFSCKLGGLDRRSGRSPLPFKAVNPPRLAGTSGTRPLRSMSVEELVHTSDGPVSREILLDRPAVDGADLENGCVVAVLAARRFRNDAAIERPAAIA
jgi:hypothetical protein